MARCDEGWKRISFPPQTFHFGKNRNEMFEEIKDISRDIFIY